MYGGLYWMCKSEGVVCWCKCVCAGVVVGVGLSCPVVVGVHCGV